MHFHPQTHPLFYGDNLPMKATRNREGTNLKTIISPVINNIPLSIPLKASIQHYLLTYRPLKYLSAAFKCTPVATFRSISIYFCVFTDSLFSCIYLSVYLAAFGLSCSPGDLFGIVQDLSLRHTTLQWWHAGLDAPRWMFLVSWPGIEPTSTARPTLNHWTAREVPTPIYFLLFLEIPTSVKKFRG